MDYLQKLQYHYRPKKGWMNDPNGLVYFQGYYHMFYQHAPNFEIPWKEPMHWGHARTKDFLTWEELPVALYPDRDYDSCGCWSGTAIVKDDALYLFYASVRREEETRKKIQTVSVARSVDGIRFEKYEGNPVLLTPPSEGGPDFRDPAVCRVGDDFYCVMASGNEEARMARLLLYKSKDLYHWDYVGVMSEWAESKYAECPSLVVGDGVCLLTTSVCPLEGEHYFSVMFGELRNDRFVETHSAGIDRGPDQYAGQVFRDHLGRCLLVSWIPGWKYSGYAERDIGCLSVPREIRLCDGVITAFPVKELQHLLVEEDPAVRRTEKGFVIERSNRSPVIYEGEVKDLKILRDGYIIEVFVNGGQEVYTALL